MRSHFSKLILVVLVCAADFRLQAQDSVRMAFRGTGAGGQGAYEGVMRVMPVNREVTELRRWTGEKRQFTKGVALTQQGAAPSLHAGFGSGLSKVMEFQIKDGRLAARWTTMAEPGKVASGALTGTQFNGRVPGAEGDLKAATFTPGSGGIFQVEVETLSGKEQGIGLQSGDFLVVALGDAKAGMGVAAYKFAPDGLEGVWATPAVQAPGSESAKQAPQREFGPGETLQFLGEAYRLEKSAGNQPGAVSEMRLYHPQGEDGTQFTKLLMMELAHVDESPGEFAAVCLKGMEKLVAATEGKVLSQTRYGATTMHVLDSGGRAGVVLTRYMMLGSLPDGKNTIVMLNFTVRPSPPFDTLDKLKEERDRRLDEWIEEVTALAEDVPRVLRLTSPR